MDEQGSEQFTAEQLREQVRAKEEAVRQLQSKLSHMRRWLASVHTHMNALHPPTVKNAQRLYVGNLPPDTSDDELKVFLNESMMRIAACVTPGKPVLACRVTGDKNFAFVELRSVEEASNALALDGVAFNGHHLRIRRPSNYEETVAMFLGPTTHDPTIDTRQLDICRSKVEDTPHKLFVGGLPCDWSEEQVKELLLPFGSLHSFSLVMDKTSGKSKGYAFCEYADASITDFVITNLNGKRQGSKVLTVKRARDGARPPSAMTAGQQPPYMPPPGMPAAGEPPHLAAAMPGMPPPPPQPFMDHGNANVGMFVAPQQPLPPPQHPPQHAMAPPSSHGMPGASALVSSGEDMLLGAMLQQQQRSGLAFMTGQHSAAPSDRSGHHHHHLLEVQSAGSISASSFSQPPNLTTRLSSPSLASSVGSPGVQLHDMLPSLTAASAGMQRLGSSATSLTRMGDDAWYASSKLDALNADCHMPHAARNVQ